MCSPSSPSDNHRHPRRPRRRDIDRGIAHDHAPRHIRIQNAARMQQRVRRRLHLRQYVPGYYGTQS
jgi:hypothetical protein